MFPTGYGANQFVPLLAVYRSTLADATAVFGVYALGLIHGLPGRPDLLDLNPGRTNADAHEHAAERWWSSADLPT